MQLSIQKLNKLKLQLILLFIQTISIILYFVIFLLKQISKNFFIIFLIFIEINFLLNSKNFNNTMTESIGYFIKFTEAAISRVKIRTNIKSNELQHWDENRYVQSVFFYAIK